MSERWYEIKNVDEVPSLALLIYADRVEQNINRMISMAGDVSRLRPHIKTHKIPEMAAAEGAEDVLLAYQPVGPNIERLVELAAHFSSVRFSCVADNTETIRALSNAAERNAARIEVLLDLDIGQHRTGIAPGTQAFE